MMHEPPPTPAHLPVAAPQQAQVPAHYYPPTQGYGVAPPEDDGLLDPLKILFLILHHRWLIAGALHF